MEGVAVSVNRQGVGREEGGGRRERDKVFLFKNKSSKLNSKAKEYN